MFARSIKSRAAQNIGDQFTAEERILNRTIQQFLVVIAAMLFSATTAFALDVNRASVEDLQNIKGVGPVIAKRIASERKKTKFKSMADLQERVPGVGPQIAANLSKGSGLPKGKASTTSKTKTAATKSSKTAKSKVTEVAGKGKTKTQKASKTAKSAKTAKTKAKGKSTKKVAKASSKSASKAKKKASTKKLAKKVSNNKKK